MVVNTKKSCAFGAGLINHPPTRHRLAHQAFKIHILLTRTSFMHSKNSPAITLLFLHHVPKTVASGSLACLLMNQITICSYGANFSKSAFHLPPFQANTFCHCSLSSPHNVRTHPSHPVICRSARIRSSEPVKNLSPCLYHLSIGCRSCSIAANFSSSVPKSFCPFHLVPPEPLCASFIELRCLFPRKHIPVFVRYQASKRAQKGHMQRMSAWRDNSRSLRIGPV